MRTFHLGSSLSDTGPDSSALLRSSLRESAGLGAASLSCAQDAADTTIFAAVDAAASTSAC